MSSKPPTWDAESLRNPHTQPDKSARVEAMFDAIAPTYERVNSVATFGMDAAWRRAAIRAAAPTPTDIVLDVCCGTGDMVRAFAAHQPTPARIIGLDFSAGMLAGGRYASMACPWHLLRGDGQRLPLRDASVDIVSCAFGIRNFQDLQRGLDEMHRVLRPGGRISLLEFSTPTNPVLRWAFETYCERVLPMLGRWFSRDPVRAYDYLPQSIRTFETTRTMQRRLGDAGFGDVRIRPMNLGGVVLYTARKPAGATPPAR